MLLIYILNKEKVSCHTLQFILYSPIIYSESFVSCEIYDESCHVELYSCGIHCKYCDHITLIFLWRASTQFYPCVFVSIWHLLLSNDHAVWFRLELKCLVYCIFLITPGNQTVWELWRVIVITSEAPESCNFGSKVQAWLNLEFWFHPLLRRDKNSDLDPNLGSELCLPSSTSLAGSSYGFLLKPILSYNQYNIISLGKGPHRNAALNQSRLKEAL